ncbi:hypothetical protein [uncultured Coprobacter sp.]|uniref:hypothetical protein n=1 Tax=uncultured Coprobacter sp. TaxID=1720550 RepID=UPI0025CD6E33|nr:hypothetical protein [uncultured Coprobacter sp.]
MKQAALGKNIKATCLFLETGKSSISGFFESFPVCSLVPAHLRYTFIGTEECL